MDAVVTCVDGNVSAVLLRGVGVGECDLRIAVLLQPTAAKVGTNSGTFGFRFPTGEALLKVVMGSEVETKVSDSFWFMAGCTWAKSHATKNKARKHWHHC